MKRIFTIFCLASFILSACAKTLETPTPIEEPKAHLQQQQPIPEPKPPTWEEQYDLGLHYLSEGNYEEAIIAFTAAIEIDPKCAPAFIGRGDTYVELARPEADLTLYDSAEKDYQTALELDDQAVDVYVKLSEVYLSIDECIKAVEILEQGYAVTGDKSLNECMNKLQKELSSGTFIGVPICNPETYQEKWDSYKKQYPTDEGFPGRVSITGYGVRFPEPIKVIIPEASGKCAEVEISEAGLVGHVEVGQITTEDGHAGPLAGKKIEFSGYFTYEDHGELGLDETSDQPWYIYYPNGPYEFHVESMHEIEVN